MQIRDPINSLDLKKKMHHIILTAVCRTKELIGGLTSCPDKSEIKISNNQKNPRNLKNKKKKNFSRTLSQGVFYTKK